jgi:hypothetical protein
MKLRIRGDSVRLRLGQSEVRRLEREGVVRERVCFGPLAGQCLVYSLRSSAEGAEIGASFDGGEIAVSVPEEIVRSWAATEQVGIEAVQAVEGTDGVRILIEKDFECTEGRAGESDEDAFQRIETACR